MIRKFDMLNEEISSFDITRWERELIPLFIKEKIELAVDSALCCVSAISLCDKVRCVFMNDFSSALIRLICSFDKMLSLYANIWYDGNNS